MKDLLIIDGCTPRIASEAMFNRIHSAGVTAVTVSLVAAEATFMEAASEMVIYHNMAEQYSDRCLIATSGADIERAKRENKLAVIFALQNGQPIEDHHLVMIPTLYRNGLRMVQLTYNERNRLGDGCLEPENRGLTLMGMEVIQELNRFGILIDLSHVGDRTAMDAIEHSKDPCVFSHADCRSLWNSPRNRTDEEIKAIASTGGLIGMTPFAPFCQPAANQRPTLDDFFRHMDHALALVGPDHVAIGTDIAEHWAVKWAGGTPRRYPQVSGTYSWQTIYADGFHSFDCIPDVVEKMSKRGYSDTDIAKIMGQNWLRVLKQVWRG